MSKLSDMTLEEIREELEETVGELDLDQMIVLKLIYEAYK